MIRVEFPYAAGCGRAFAMRCHVISSLTNTVFFRWGTVTLTFPPYRYYCRPSRPPKLCSRLHKCTMFRKVCQHLQYASQFCLKLLEAVTQQAQIACLQQLAGTVQHLLGGCILFSEQVQFGQPEVNLDMQVRCCYERSLCTCLFKQEDSSLQIAPSLS